MSRLIPSVNEIADEVCDAAGDDAATRLRAAIDTRRELTKIGDALVERFAAQERDATVNVLAGGWRAELADRFAGP